jgi:hypothetical protein
LALKRVQRAAELLSRRHPKEAGYIESFANRIEHYENSASLRALKKFRSYQYVYNKVKNPIVALSFLQGIDWRKSPKQIEAYLGLLPEQRIRYNSRMKAVSLLVSYYLAKDRDEFEKLYKERLAQEMPKVGHSKHAQVRARRYILKKFIRTVRKKELGLE